MGCCAAVLGVGYFAFFNVPILFFGQRQLSGMRVAEAAARTSRSRWTIPGAAMTTSCEAQSHCPISNRMGSGLGIWEAPAYTGAAVGARVCQLAFARGSFDLTVGHLCVSGADCLSGVLLTCWRAAWLRHTQGAGAVVDARVPSECMYVRVHVRG